MKSSLSRLPHFLSLGSCLDRYRSTILEDDRSLTGCASSYRRLATVRARLRLADDTEPGPAATEDVPIRPCLEDLSEKVATQESPPASRASAAKGSLTEKLDDLALLESTEDLIEQARAGEDIASAKQLHKPAFRALLDLQNAFALEIGALVPVLRSGREDLEKDLRGQIEAIEKGLRSELDPILLGPMEAIGDDQLAAEYRHLRGGSEASKTEKPRRGRGLFGFRFGRRNDVTLPS